MDIPFCRHSVGQEEADEVLATLRSDWLTSGPKTREFERSFADYIGAEHAVAVNSCTAALHLALLAEGVGPGDEVITTPFTFCATVEAIEYCGARPVFVDIDPETFNLDVRHLVSKIGPRTKCILPVHYGGIPCDLKNIYRLAEEHGLLVVEDAAHALGSSYRGKRIGSFGHATCFSFYPTKNMTTGEGGMITLNDGEAAERMRVLSLHGLSKDAWGRYDKHGHWYYEIHHLGYKYNLTDIQAALGICQLRKLEAFNRIRESQARLYCEILADCEEIAVPAWYESYFRDHRDRGDVSSWHLFVIMLNADRVTIDRDRLIQELNLRNIGTSVHFIPLHLQPYYAQRYGLQRGAFPVAEQIYERVVSLPIYPRLSEGDILYTTDALKQIAHTHRR